MSPSEGYLLIFSYIMMTLVVVLSGLILYHRKYFPISGTMYHMLLLTGVGMFLGYFSTSQQMYTKPYDIFWHQSVPVVIGNYFLASSYTIRAFILWFRYKIGEGVRLFRRDGTTTWFLTNRHLISSEKILAFWVCDLVIHAIVLCFLPNKEWGFNLAPRVLLWCFIGFHFFACILIALGMRKFSNDGFYLKAEFRVVGVLLLVDAAAQFLAPPVNQLVQSITFTVSVVTSFVLPIYRSFASRDADTSKSLSKFLAGSQDHWDDYFSFLELEFCSENLLFWTEVQNLRTKEDNDKFVATVNYIYNNFLSPTAPLPVNVAASSRDQVTKAMEEWTTHGWEKIVPADAIKVFEGVEADIYRIMNLGSFPRFMRWKVSQHTSSVRREGSSRKEGSKRAKKDDSSHASSTGGSPRSMPSLTLSSGTHIVLFAPQVEVVITASDVPEGSRPGF